MKKPILATTVGALIIFIWGSVSWMVLPIHHTTFLYNPQQDMVLQSIRDNTEESGVYMLPAADNRKLSAFDMKYMEESHKVEEANQGKPFAVVFYNKGGMEMKPTMFIMGYILQLISVFIVVVFLSLLQDRFTTFFERWTLVMFFAVIVSVEGYLMAWNWMGHPWHYIRGFIIDTYLSFALCGLWLAYYLGRKAG